MNHLESTFAGKNSFWRYAVMIVAVFLAANTIGAVPLIIAMAARSVTNPDVFTQIAANPNDFSSLGLDPNSGLIMMLFPFVAGLVTFILLVYSLNNRTIRQTINGTNKIRWSHFFISGLIWLGFSATYLFVYMKIDPSNFTINNTTVSLIILIVITILFIPFQAAFEEVLFRGYLMQGFTAIMKNRWFPLVMTSLMFALMHAFNPEVKEFGFYTMMPQYIVFGLIFGAITILDDGIEAAMGAHTANNIFLCIMVTNKSSALQTPALYVQNNITPWTEFAGLLISGIVFILVLKFVFKWSGFSLLWTKVEILTAKNAE